MILGEKVLKIWKAEVAMTKKDLLLKKELKVAKMMSTKKNIKNTKY